MKKTPITIMLILAIITISLITPQTTIKAENNNLRIFEFPTDTKITLTTEYKPSTILDPGSEREIEFLVSFKYELPQFFPKFLIGTKIGNWIIFRDGKHDNSIDVSLEVEYPDWCNITLKDKDIKIEDISYEKYVSTQTSMTIKVEEDVSAFTQGEITIKAEFNPEDKCGLTSSKNETKFNIMSNYKSKLTTKFNLEENTSEIKIKHGDTAKLYLNLTNQGNDDTIVNIKPKDEDANWQISIDKKVINLDTYDVEIPKNGKKIVEIEISVIGSDVEEISYIPIFELTPRAKNNETSHGSTQTLTAPKIIKREKDNLNDILMLVLYAAIILVIIVIIIFFVRKKIKK